LKEVSKDLVEKEKGHFPFTCNEKSGLIQVIFEHDDVSEPNRVWVSDITYFKVKDEYSYICVVPGFVFQEGGCVQNIVEAQYLSDNLHIKMRF
jgi:hypothetical protein